MADPIQMIKADHREVERLFEEFQAGGDRGVAMAICTELKVHTTLEEELVYPLLERIDTPLEREGEKEHDEADRLIRDIERQHDPMRLRQLMAQLRQAVHHHVEEEESESLPKLERQCGTELATLAPKLQERKQTLMAEAKGGAVTGAMATTMTTSFSGATTSESQAPPATTATKKEELLDLTKEELLDKARKADIAGRSKMKKDDLAEALARRA